MREYADAKRLAHALVDVGTGAGKEVVALLTDMNQPLGHAVGNSLEVEESIVVLRGGGPADVRELTLALGAEMVVLGGKAESLEAAHALLVDKLDSGAALEHFGKIIEAQHGDPRVIDDLSLLPRAPRLIPVRAERPGVVTEIACAEIGRIAGAMGAGRTRAEDAVDPAVGLELHVRIGQEVREGDPLATLHARDDAHALVARVVNAVAIDDGPAIEHPLIAERITSR